jgi:phosphoribosyl 1,2-cyclic phosphodiesterase
MWVLGSGSRGNAVLFESGQARLLVDAGFGVRALEARLRAAGVSPESVGACVITHEHADHVRGAAPAAARWGWALHATGGTIAATPSLLAAGARAFAAGERLAVAGFEVETAATPHDARESVALAVTAQATGARAAVCYDLGAATDPVRALLGGAEAVVLEANHDEGMLRAGPYPPSVAARIGGRHGHLSNTAAGRLARDVAGGGLRHVVLAHLSESCNAPELATGAVRGALAPTRFRGAVTAAPQEAVVGPFVLTRAGRDRRAADPGQLSFGL